MRSTLPARRWSSRAGATSGIEHRPPARPAPLPWEQAYGFSRVVRAGEIMLVAGTTSVDVDGVVVGDAPYGQARVILTRIVAELERAGAQPTDVVRTRAYVTDISRPMRSAGLTVRRSERPAR
jgi:enamine deaminase RidA (YjgF/YER057c/UK114 family)